MGTEHRFHLLDVVRVASSEVMVSAGEAGRCGIVLQIRRYPDDTYRYSLGYMADGGLGGLYGEEHLEPTGERHDLSDAVLVQDGREATSLRVSESGAVAGEESYVIVGEVSM